MATRLSLILSGGLMAAFLIPPPHVPTPTTAAASVPVLTVGWHHRDPETVTTVAKLVARARQAPPTTVVRAPSTTAYKYPAPRKVAVKSVTPVNLPAVWACIAQHESGGNPAENTGNGYFGEFQFVASTWLTVMRQMGLGYRTYPYAAAAPASVQLAAAEHLQAEAGWGQWPVTSRECGV